MSSVTARYDALVANGELRADPEQASAADRLTRLQQELEAVGPSSLIGKLFGSKQEQPRGLYMWGGVGRGK